MFPVLFSIGSFSVSSFGVFLIFSFLLGLFLVWRLGRAWDLDEEKLLDITLLTIIGGLIGARLFFIFEHFSFFGLQISKWVFFYKFPGFSFWGGFLGGWLSFYYFSKKFKQNLPLLADIASIGFLAGLAVSNIGCFLGSCNIGGVSRFFLSVEMVGQIGKRFPVQILEALLFFLVIWKIWGLVKHFHKAGKIAAISFIFFGLIELLLQPLKVANASNYFFSFSSLILGLVIFYKVTKRNLFKDLKIFINSFKRFFKDSQYRKNSILSFKKSWYNHKVEFLWNIKNLAKKLRRLNVYFSHKNSKFY